MTNKRRPLNAFLNLRVVVLGTSAAMVTVFSLFFDECIGFSMLKEVIVVVVDVVDAEVDVLVGAAVDA